MLKQEVQKLSNNEDGRFKKLAGELDDYRQQLQVVQNNLMERGTTIANLEQQLAALSLNTLNVTNPHMTLSVRDAKSHATSLRND